MWVRPGNLKNGKWVRGEPKSMRLKWPAGWKFNNLGELASIPASLGQWLKAEFWDLLKEGIRDELILEEGLGYLVRIFGVPAEISDIISEAFGSGDVVRMRAQRASLVHNAQTVTGQTTAPSIQGVSAETEAAADTSINSAMAEEHRQAAQDLEQTQLRTEEELAQIDSRIGEKQRELFRMYNHAQDATKIAFAKTLADIVNLKSLQKAQTFLRSQIELLKSGKFSAARLERAMDTKTFTMLEYGYQKRFPADTARHALRAINAIFATMQRIGIHEAVQTRAALVAQLRASGQEVPVKLTMQSFIDFMRQQFGADVGNTIMYTIDDAQGVHHGIDEVMAADIAVVDEWMDGGRVTSIDPKNQQGGTSNNIQQKLQNLINNVQLSQQEESIQLDKLKSDYKNKKISKLRTLLQIYQLNRQQKQQITQLKKGLTLIERAQNSLPSATITSFKENLKALIQNSMIMKYDIKTIEYDFDRKNPRTIDFIKPEQFRRLINLLSNDEIIQLLEDWSSIQFGASEYRRSQKKPTNDFEIMTKSCVWDFKDVLSLKRGAIGGAISDFKNKIEYGQKANKYVCVFDAVYGTYNDGISTIVGEAGRWDSISNPIPNPTDIQKLATYIYTQMGRVYFDVLIFMPNYALIGTWNNGFLVLNYIKWNLYSY
nr:hypothetical protein [Candidatus Sigynarchaeota archaeon]